MRGRGSQGEATPALAAITTVQGGFWIGSQAWSQGTGAFPPGMSRGQVSRSRPMPPTPAEGALSLTTR